MTFTIRETRKSNNKKRFNLLYVSSFGRFGWAQPFYFFFMFYMKSSCDVKFCNNYLVSILHYLFKMFYSFISLVKLIKKNKPPNTKPTTKKLPNELSRNIFFLFKFNKTNKTNSLVFNPKPHQWKRHSEKSWSYEIR